MLRGPMWLLWSDVAPEDEAGVGSIPERLPIAKIGAVAHGHGTE